MSTRATTDEAADTGKLDPIRDQPPPTPNGYPPVWDLVVLDMKERDRIGRERYGTPLQPMNGRDPLVDAYQEALDLAVYLRQAIFERDIARGVNARDQVAPIETRSER